MPFPEKPAAEQELDDGWPDDPFERPTVIPPETLPSHSLTSASQHQRAATAKMAAVVVPPAAITRSRPRSVAPIEALRTPIIEINEPELELIMEGDGVDEQSGEQLVGGWLGLPPSSIPDELELDFDNSTDRATPRPSGLLLEDRMVERFSSGQFEAALAAAEEILRTNPTAEVAREYADSCRNEIRNALIQRLISVHYIPRLAVPLHAIPRATLDHRTGFLLSRVDGWSTLEDVLDISGMDSIDALRILCSLVDDGIIAMHAR